MAFENKLGITDSAQLAREEEKISKAKAKELFESGILDSLHPGTYVHLPGFMNFCLTKYMILQAKCEL